MGWPSAGMAEWATIQYAHRPKGTNHKIGLVLPGKFFVQRMIRGKCYCQHKNHSFQLPCFFYRWYERRGLADTFFSQSIFVNAPGTWWWRKHTPTGWRFYSAPWLVFYFVASRELRHKRKRLTISKCHYQKYNGSKTTEGCDESICSPNLVIKQF